MSELPECSAPPPGLHAGAEPAGLSRQLPALGPGGPGALAPLSHDGSGCFSFDSYRTRRMGQPGVGHLSCGLFEGRVGSSLWQENCHQLGDPQMPTAVISLASYLPPWLHLSPQVIVGAAIPASQDVRSLRLAIVAVGELAVSFTSSV